MVDRPGQLRRFGSSPGSLALVTLLGPITIGSDSGSVWITDFKGTASAESSGSRLGLFINGQESDRLELGEGFNAHTTYGGEGVRVDPGETVEIKAQQDVIGRISVTLLGATERRPII